MAVRERREVAHVADVDVDRRGRARRTVPRQVDAGPVPRRQHRRSGHRGAVGNRGRSAAAGVRRTRPGNQGLRDLDVVHPPLPTRPPQVAGDVETELDVEPGPLHERCRERFVEVQAIGEVALDGLGDFVEIFCDTPLSVCESRDIKGFYKKARAGEIPEFTGISSPYETPEQPELIVESGSSSIEECVDDIINFLKEKDII